MSSAAVLRLGFAGTPAFAVPALDTLLASRHSVCAVLTQPDRPAGRGRMLQISAVKQRALESGIKLYQPLSCKSPEVAQLFGELQLDALVVVAYGLILPRSVLNAPRLGCFNIHASLLPRWRGAAPIQRALLAGDTVTGVTIMRMEEGLDTGPMLAARKIEVGATETTKSLQDRLASLGAELMAESLEDIAAGTLREQSQPTEGVTYAEKILKAEALIDWRQDAVHILRRIRAFNPWPVAETRLAGQQLRIWEADLAGMQSAGAALPGTPLPGTVLRASAAGIEVACGIGAVRISRLQAAGRKALLAADFLTSMPLVDARFEVL